MTNFIFKMITDKDTDLINEVSHWQTMRYGYKIEPETTKNFIYEHLDNEFSTLVCCYNNNEPVGFNVMHRLGNFLPFWHMGFVITKPNDQGQGIMTALQFEVCSSLIDYNCKLAESEERYDWFVAHVDSRGTSMNRQPRLSKLIIDRYDSYDVARIEPGTKSKYEYINRLVGDRPFKRPLIIEKRSLKAQFRNV
jgi:hypothetical protein